MLTTLASIKSRLSIPEADTTYDTLLTNAIAATSARFENECNRHFGLSEFVEEFPANDTEIHLSAFPLASVTSFEIKSNESEGWVAAGNDEHLIRDACVISLPSPLGTARQQARITYIGGYVLPGNEVGPGQIPLPVDIEHAAIEQVAFWFQSRDRLGILRTWPHDGTYQQFALLDLLPSVRAILNQYARWIP